MIRSIYTINRNMNILQKKQENTSANIANTNTPGYKYQNIIQSTLESKEMINYKGGIDGDRKQVLGNFIYGNQIDGVYKNFEQGSLSQTFKPTDFAIIGNGFFTIQRDNGEVAFTKNGNFRLNEQNQLVTLEGYPVVGVDNMGQQSFVYLENDNINADINLLITDFDDYSTLISMGDTIFTGGQGGNNIIAGEVKQGFLEMSNVKIVDELIKMIEVSREFESNQKLLHTADETLSKAVNEIGRV